MARKVEVEESERARERKRKKAAEEEKARRRRRRRRRRKESDDFAPTFFLFIRLFLPRRRFLNEDRKVPHRRRERSEQRENSCRTDTKKSGFFLSLFFYTLFLCFIFPRSVTSLSPRRRPTPALAPHHSLDLLLSAAALDILPLTSSPDCLSPSSFAALPLRAA